jgi:hypothetical protein
MIHLPKIVMRFFNKRRKAEPESAPGFRLTPEARSQSVSLVDLDDLREAVWQRDHGPRRSWFQRGVDGRFGGR